MQDFHNASQSYGALTQACPEVDEYKIYQVQSLLKAGMYEEASQVCTTIENPNFTERVMLLQAAVSYEQDEVQLARSILDQCSPDELTNILMAIDGGKDLAIGAVDGGSGGTGNDFGPPPQSPAVEPVTMPNGAEVLSIHEQDPAVAAAAKNNAMQVLHQAITLASSSDIFAIQYPECLLQRFNLFFPACHAVFVANTSIYARWLQFVKVSKRGIQLLLCALEVLRLGGLGLLLILLLCGLVLDVG